MHPVRRRENRHQKRQRLLERRRCLAGLHCGLGGLYGQYYRHAGLRIFAGELPGAARGAEHWRLRRREHLSPATSRRNHRPSTCVTVLASPSPPPPGARMSRIPAVTLAAFAALALGAPSAPAQQGAPDLTGLWAAKVRFGPDIKGPLTLLREGTAWRADIAGFSVPARFDGPAVSFELPDGKGTFRGRMSRASIT